MQRNLAPRGTKYQLCLPFLQLWQPVDKLRPIRRVMLKDIVALRSWRIGRGAVMICLLIGMAATSTVGCTDGPQSGGITDPADSSGATAASMPTDTDTPTVTAIPSPTFVPTHAPIAELSPAEVYERVAPTVAFIETPRATGSGVLVQDGYVVTNFHVVWPYDSGFVVLDARTGALVSSAVRPCVSWTACGTETSRRRTCWRR